MPYIISKTSGYYFDRDDLYYFRLIQGDAGSSFVAGKQLLYRAYVDVNILSSLAYAWVTVEPSNGLPNQAYALPSEKLIFDTTPLIGPSIGTVFPGYYFPRAGTYRVTILFFNHNGEPAKRTTHTIVFLPTKDLRLLVVPFNRPGVFNVTPEWFVDIDKSMIRLNSMFPVRDYAQKLNGARIAGIRYQVGTTCDGWSGFNDCAYGQTRLINATIFDHIDLTIEFRWWIPGSDPRPGGNSARPAPPYDDLRRAQVVGGPYNGVQMTACSAGQEIGHNFGLEPPGSPYYQDPQDPGHSNSPRILDIHAYDFVNNKSYFPWPLNSFLGDVMNNFAGGVWQGADLAMFNWYDWDHLREQFMGLDSTGTEINPFIPGSLSTRATVEWLRLLEDREKQSQLRWGDFGLYPITAPGNIEIGGSLVWLVEALHRCREKGIDHVHIPFANDFRGSVSTPAFPSLDRPNLNADSSK